MHGNSNDRRALEREALRNVINQWNANRLDLFELSEPNEDLEFHGVMRFYFQDSGQKVATKCIRVASDATVDDVIGTLVEKFRPDMRMLSVPSYALFELHEGCAERKMADDEKPLLVQLNWHVDDREGRFLLRNIDDKTVHSMGSMDSNASFRRKLSKREKKQLKKQEKLSRLKSENGDINDDGVAEKLYTELPETSFTRSISNPEAVMRRRRQQKLEKKLQQFRSKDGGPDTGGTLKIYGEALCKDVPYKTLLLSIRDCAGAVVREMLDKYGLSRADPSQWCLVQVTQSNGGGDDAVEYVLDDDECPLSILMTSQNSGSIMFHVRRRPADCAPRKRKKKPAGAAGGGPGGQAGGAAQGSGARDARGDAAPVLVELGPDGSTPRIGDAATRAVRLTGDVMEVGSANGIALQLYGPHIQPRHCVISTAGATDGAATLTPCHADAHTYVDGRRIHQTTPLRHGSVVKFGQHSSNAYRFLDPAQEERLPPPLRPPFFGAPAPDDVGGSARPYDSRSPRALSPTDQSRENIETTFDLDGNVETISTTSGAREDNRSLGSASENRLERYPRGQDPILPAVLEFPEEPQEQFLARVITHLDVATPTFRLAPAYALYLCARYRASTHYRPELTPTERAHKLTLLLQHAAMLIRHTVQDRSTESGSQAFWLANASELLHFLKSDRHVGAFSLQAQDALADAVQLAFKNLVACLVDELNGPPMAHLMSPGGDDHPRDVVNVLSGAMNLLRRCRVNAALTIQLFSQLFHWVSAKALSNIISNSALCTKSFGNKLFHRLRNLQAWAESQGLELAAECHLAKIVQCAHLLQAPKSAPEDLAALSAACFKLNSMQLGALLMQYKPEPGESLAPPSLLEQAAKAAEGVADELARAEGREVALYEDPAPPLQLLLPDDGFSCDVVQGVPPGLADFLHPLQAAGLCRLAAQPTSSGRWTVYMAAARPVSALGAAQPEVQVIRLHKAAGGGMGLSIVAAKGAGQERLGIYVKSVVAGGAADRDGRLAAGDQLLSVDGQSLLGITQERAAEFLQRTGGVVALEVAKAGAVYHGLASLLQQPSPTPHRALDKFYYCGYDSTESLYSPKNHRLFTPPATKTKNNIFFCSDDSLFKSEKRKFTIPRIEIESDEPVFNLQVTDFSEPSPKNVTLTYDETGQSMRHGKVEEFCAKPTAKTLKDNFAQQKSYSIEVNNSERRIDQIGDLDKFLSIGARRRQQQRWMSASLQDLSSSTSSINSGVHESNLDLSRIDPDTPVRRKSWRSPYEIRHGNAKDLAKRFEDKATSVPVLNERKFASSRSKSVSEERLDDRLTEYERLEIFKLLHDWSLDGSESKTEFNVKLSVPLARDRGKFSSEPDLSPKAQRDVIKFPSDNTLTKKTSLDQFFHNCEYRNCIFNLGTKDGEEALHKGKPRGILKQAKKPVECLNNITNLQNKPNYRRRHSEVIDTKPFNTELVRCDSLERLNDLKRKHKKFPDSYIVTRRNSVRKSERNNNNNNENIIGSPKETLVRKKYLPKTWKSCSDIKTRKTIVRKCCRNAKKTCPVLKDCANSPKMVARKAQSCASIDQDEGLVSVEAAARLGALRVGASANRPRRMSERDLPSKVDSERTIPSSKSVPALHQIHSPISGDPASRSYHHDPYSRTSSNNSINNGNNAPAALSNGNAAGYGTVNPALRSRSTHNLHQQDAGGFYQNLSIYRNQVPSPQHLGDRTSALRSSQNSLHSSVANSQQRPTSAYYPPPSTSTNATRPANLHQSIPNLKSPPSTHRPHPALHPSSVENEPNNGGRAGSYPNVQQQQGYYPPAFGPRSPGFEGGTKGQYQSPAYANSVQAPLHVIAGQRHQHDERQQQQEARFSNNGLLLREDVFRQSHGSRHEEILRYPSQGNIRISEAHHHMQQNVASGGGHVGEMRPSKSEDALKHHHAHYPPSDMTRYSSSGNIRDQSKIEQQQQQPPRAGNEERQLRGAAKLAEMSEEVRRRQNRGQYAQQQQQQQYYMMAQNAQSMQNLSIAGHQAYQHQSHPSPTYKIPPVVPKTTRKEELPSLPDPPPTTTHPLYSASSQDPPKVGLYPAGAPGGQSTAVGGSKPPPRDPWAREERERQQEARREAARQWQEGQLRELAALPYRTAQQEEQLRVLRLEREFQRRALEAAEDLDDDTEKESSSSPQTSPAQSASGQSPPSSSKQLEQLPPPPPLHLPPASILKPNNGGQPSPPEVVAQAVPPPPERGSSFAVMSMRAKDTTKRVSFNDAGGAAVPATPPNTLPIEEVVREDPNAFIRQAESMLASPTTPTSPTDASSPPTATPGVIGAQEVYRDPRARRLAEQAQRRDGLPQAVPEKLSFKEKMKMFAMETGERETPKDKSKISRAQRDIDNLGSPASMVH